MSNPLYKISNDLNELMTRILDNEGEVTPEMDMMLQEMNVAIAMKTDNIVEYVHSMEMFAERARSKAAEFSDIAESIEIRMSKLDEYVDKCLSQLMVQKLEGHHYVINKRKPSQMLLVENESLVPVEFIKIPEVTPQVMKAEITKAIKAGATVPGCRIVESKKISIEYKPKKGGK